MSEETLGGLWFALEAKSGEFMNELDAAEKRFAKTKKAAEAVSETISKVGLAFSAFGGVVVGSLALAAKSFAGTGDALDEMSARTGMSTKSLQELGYIAKLAGGSIEGIEVSVKRMASVITDARAGMTGAVDSIHALNLKVSDLIHLSPDQQFDKIAAALAGIEDPTQRASLALDLFGRTGTSLLPMFSGGAAGIQKMREQADKFAGVMDKDAVNAAVHLSDQLDNLQVSLATMWRSIGQNVAPSLDGLVASIQSVVGAVTKWVNAHPQLTTAVAGLALAVGALASGTGLFLVVLAKLITSFATLQPLIVTKIIPAIKGLWVALAANPLPAITAAVYLAYIALLNFLVARKEEQNANINTGKTLEQKIALMEAEKKKWKEIATSGSSSLEEQKAALSKYNAAVYASTEYQKQLDREKRDVIAKARAAQDAANAAADAAYLAKNREYQDALMNYQIATQQKSLEDRAVFLQEQLTQTEVNSVAYLAIKQAMYDNDVAIMKAHHISVKTAQDKLDQDITTGFRGAMMQMATDGTNFYDIFTAMMNNAKSSISISFQQLFANLSDGWSAFADFTRNITKAIGESIITAMSDIIASEIVAHATRLALGKSFEKAQIASAARIGAANAAAASAWSLWGAIGIGLAIGAAIMALAGKFEHGGFVGGSSYTGDHVLAAVNSGEFIASGSQQRNLLDLANGQGGSGSRQTIIMQLDGRTVAKIVAENFPSVLRLYGAAN